MLRTFSAKDNALYKCECVGEQCFSIFLIKKQVKL